MEGGGLPWGLPHEASRHQLSWKMEPLPAEGQVPRTPLGGRTGAPTAPPAGEGVLAASLPRPLWTLFALAPRPWLGSCWPVSLFSGQTLLWGHFSAAREPLSGGNASGHGLAASLLLGPQVTLLPTPSPALTRPPGGI